jgi:hypothetical protein
MGSYYAVIGILLFSTLAIFVGSTLGVIAFDDFSENSNKSALPIKAEPLYMLEYDKPENILDTVINAKPGCPDESVDQTVYNPKHHYVEMGEIKFVEDSFVDDLPICMSIEYGMDQWVIIGVKGGYTPTLKNYLGNPAYSAYGLMYLKDADGNIVFNDCNPGMFVGWLLDSYTEILCPDDDCCWTYYNFTLNPELCMNWVCLDSSYDLDQQFHEEKYYTIEYDTHWKGCEFDFILAHVNRVPGIPNTR